MEFKENEVKRTESIKIRLTPGERARLDEIKARPELARWIRELALSGQGGRSHVVKHSLPIELTRVISGIGNNLNQMARIMNQQAKEDNLDLKQDALSIMLQLQATEEALNQLWESLKDDRSVLQ